MPVVICPGVHAASLTSYFVKALPMRSELLIVPHTLPVYSAPHILAFLQQQILPSQRHLPILLIGFSAGVVGAIGAAYLWQSMGGQIAALIAIDGWGVPLFGSFPVHRISHDAFTHWSSRLLGTGQDSFYAEPAVAHLELWRSPQTVMGWSIRCSDQRHHRTTAAEFLKQLVQQYQIEAMER
jgi:pimeloyl-ACP methyl ester carboxylesterase